MAGKTAIEVAEMESEIILLRNNLRDAENRAMLAENERDGLRIEVAMVSQRAREELIRATHIESMMHHVSAALVSGLKKINERKAIEQAGKAAVKLSGDDAAKQTAAFLERRQEARNAEHDAEQPEQPQTNGHDADGERTHIAALAKPALDTAALLPENGLGKPDDEYRDTLEDGLRELTGAHRGS